MLHGLMLNMQIYEENEDKPEKMLRKTGNEEHENEYNILRKQTTLLAQSKKKTYINDKLSSDISSKNMYTVVNKLLDNNHEQYCPHRTLILHLQMISKHISLRR